MKFYTNIFIALIACIMAYVLAPEAERTATPVQDTEGISAEVLVENMVLSSIRHRDAAVSGPGAFRSVENSARAKGGKTHYAQLHSTAYKERRTSSRTYRLLLYKNHSNFSVSAPRSADKYVYALERIII